MLEDLPVGLAPDQADGQPAAQLAAGGLVPDPPVKPGPQDMELSFLCGLRRYADHAAEAGGGPRWRPGTFGIITVRQGTRGCRRAAGSVRVWCPGVRSGRSPVP